LIVSEPFGPCQEKTVWCFAALILHPLQRSVASGLSDPSGSCTPSTDLWPLDCRIHLDPAPFPRICGFWIVGSFWILHPSQGSGSLDPRIRLDPAPLTRIGGLWIVGSIWITHPSQGSVASGSLDPSGSCTPPRDLGPWILGSAWILHRLQGSVAFGSWIHS